MKEAFARTELLLGKEALRTLAAASVAVFGIGGVGGYAVEALARSGVGHIALIDHDSISESNLNRQIIALRSTIGRRKVDVMKERIADINPDCAVTAHPCFYLPETAGQFDLAAYDYIIDAVDTVTAKLALIVRAGEAMTPVISSMGAGNKCNPAAFEIADIYETSVCPLAKVMRRELKKRGISRCKVVYSKEMPVKHGTQETSGVLEDAPRQKQVPGSIAFVPSVAGLLLAGEVVKDLVFNVKNSPYDGMGC